LKKSIVFLKYALKMDLVKGAWFDLYKRAVSVSDYKHLIFWDSHSIVGVHAKACHI